MDANRCACIKRFAVTLVPPFPRGLSYTCSFAFLAAHARMKGLCIALRPCARFARVESPFGRDRDCAGFADFYGDWQHCVRSAMANGSARLESCVKERRTRSKRKKRKEKE